jgi:hypothetical protein
MENFDLFVAHGVSVEEIAAMDPADVVAQVVELGGTEAQAQALLAEVNQAMSRGK